MSQMELKRLHVIQKSEEKRITQKQAANILNISLRQYGRCVKNFREAGHKGLVHKLRGKSSNRAFSPEKERKIINIYKDDFLGYKPTFFTEKLLEEYSITISSEKIRQLLIKNDLWTPKKKHRSQRERKHHFGELLQLDGSPHQWFPGSNGYCVLMLFVDDATSNIFAKFYPYEGTIPAMDLLRRYITKYGIPVAIYLDRHSTYKNNTKKLSIQEQLSGTLAETQFSKAVNELAIEMIHAYSPQAKGRVERNFKTLQDRLCKELHRHGITTIKEANAFLPDFLKEYNRKFTVTPVMKANLHRPALPVTMLKNILCIKTTHSIANNFTVRHNNQLFQITQSTIHKKAVVEDHIDGSIKIRINGKLVHYKNISHLLTKTKRRKQLPNFIKIDPVHLKEIAG